MRRRRQWSIVTPAHTQLGNAVRLATNQIQSLLLQQARLAGGQLPSARQQNKTRVTRNKIQDKTKRYLLSKLDIPTSPMLLCPLATSKGPKIKWSRFAVFHRLYILSSCTIQETVKPVWTQRVFSNDSKTRFRSEPKRVHQIKINLPTPMQRELEALVLELLRWRKIFLSTEQSLKPEATHIVPKLNYTFCRWSFTDL